MTDLQTILILLAAAILTSFAIRIFKAIRDENRQQKKLKSYRQAYEDDRSSAIRGGGP